MRLADSADRRGQPHYAALLYLYAADDEDRDGAVGIVRLLAERGCMDKAVKILCEGLRSGDRAPADLVAELLADEGLVDALRGRADAGDRFAMSRLAQLLAHAGLIDELRERAAAGDGYAADRLVRLLARGGPRRRIA